MYADELKKYANEETVAVPPPMEVKLQELAEGSGLCPDSPLSAIPCAHFICHPLCAALSIPPPFFKAHSAVTGFQLQLLLVSLLSEKSTSLEASYQNLLQQGGWLKLSGMTCGLAGSGGGDKCMANLWNI